MPGRRYRKSIAEEDRLTTSRAWSQGGKRRQAGPFVDLQMLYSCPPGRSGIVSHPRDTCVPCSERSAGVVVRRGERVVVIGKVIPLPRPGLIASPLPCPSAAVSLPSRPHTVLDPRLPDPSLGMGNRAKAWSSRGNRSVTSPVGTRESYEAVRRVL